jgi:hypothetical protein
MLTKGGGRVYAMHAVKTFIGVIVRSLEPHLVYYGIAAKLLAAYRMKQNLARYATVPSVSKSPLHCLLGDSNARPRVR